MVRNKFTSSYGGSGFLEDENEKGCGLGIDCCGGKDESEGFMGIDDDSDGDRIDAGGSGGGIIGTVGSVVGGM
jgi:hypothetical protein